MNTNGHYYVTYWKDGGRQGQVNAICCNHCDYFEKPFLYRRGGDRSGLARYGRARAQMVKHLHEKHRVELQKAILSAEGLA